MAAIAAALALPQETEACRRFCGEILASERRWGPAEQRVLFEQLPLVFQRLYAWLSLSLPGIEEALLQVFRPQGPLALHLAGWGAPAFVFPLQRLPPRALRAAVLTAMPGEASTSPLAALGAAVGGAVGGFVRGRASEPQDFGSGWFGLLGRKRLIRTPAGDVEGVALTAQEYTLTCLVHYLACHQAGVPPLQASGLLGRGGASGGVGGGLALSGGSAFGGAGGHGVGGGPGAGMASGASQGQGDGAYFSLLGGLVGGAGRSRPPGSVSIAFERLLLAHLEAHLPRSEYELAYANEPFASRFLLHLLHEFLLDPQPPQAAMPLSLRGYAAGIPPAQDARSLPGPLHAARIVAVHVLANPALRRGCEEALGGFDSGFGGSGGRFSAAGARGGSQAVARLTREAALLGPPLHRMVEELLSRVTVRRQVSLETVTSVTRLWLVLVQPWKAARLHAWYKVARDPEPRPEASQLQAAVASGMNAASRMLHLHRNADVALLGLEPETPLGSPEPPPPQLPQGFGAEPMPGAPMGGAAAGGRAYFAGGPAAAVQLVPCAGDAQSWRSYVEHFRHAYSLLEAVLTAPLHEQLCVQLCRQRWPDLGADVPGAAADVGFGASSARLGEGAAATRVDPRQRHVVAALKTLGQVLLCFTDPQLLRVLSAPPSGLPPGRGAPGRAASGPHESLHLPLFSEAGAATAGHGGAAAALRPQVVLAVSVTWAALLAVGGTQSSEAAELQPLLSWISRQLQHTQAWGIHAFPTMDEAEPRQKAFAQQAMREHVQRHPGRAGPPGGALRGSPACEALFIGSEWQRPLRGGEWELLLCLAYGAARLVDRLLGREPRGASCGLVPQTEWPRMFANTNFIGFVLVLLILAILW